MRRQIMAWGLLLFILSGCSTPEVAQTKPVTFENTTSRVTMTLSKNATSQTSPTPVTMPTQTNPTPSPTQTKPEVIAPSDLKPDSEFTLVVSGDVLSHENNWRAAQVSDGSFDYMPQFEALKGLLSAGDLTLVNLETPVSGEKYGYRGFPKFNAPLNMAQTLKAIGVDLVITANNHILDNGFKGLVSNLDNLDKIGLLHTGAARTQAEAEAPFILDINGIKTGFAASTIQLSMNVTKEYSVPLNREKTIRHQIQTLRAAGAELIVFHIHWGKEYKEFPSKMQRALYQILEAEGVDIVIGSHPHRLQPMELRQIEYQGQKKATAVIWSTANLSWAEPISRDYVNTGAVFRIGVERQDGIIKVKSLNYDLVYNLTTKTAGGVRYTKIIPESDIEAYKTKYPAQYADMLEEFAWAKGVLNSKVKLAPHQSN